MPSSPTPLLVVLLLVPLSLCALPGTTHNLPPGLSDPDERVLSGDPRLPRPVAEHGHTVSSHGSTISRQIGRLRVAEWEMKHGFVEDVVGDRNAMDGAYAWKHAEVVNTDVALRDKLSPFDYAMRKKKAAQDDADMIGPSRHTDSTVPSDTDPATRVGARNYNAGDARVAMRALYPDRRFRGEADPEAAEITKRNRQRQVPMDDLFPVPATRLVKVPTRSGPNENELGDMKDWEDLTAGVRDTEGTRVTDPAILATHSQGLSESLVPEIDVAGPSDSVTTENGIVEPSLKNIPTFDIGMQRRRSNEFANPAYKGMVVRSRRAARKAASTSPFDAKSANAEGLMMFTPPSEVAGSDIDTPIQRNAPPLKR